LPRLNGRWCPFLNKNCIKEKCTLWRMAEDGESGNCPIWVIERSRDEGHPLQTATLFDRVVEISPISITVVNAEGNITFVNSQTERVLGLKKEAVIHHHYNDLIWIFKDLEGEPLSEELLPFQQIRTSVTPLKDVRRALQRPDGQRAILSINAAPLLDSEGNFEGMVVTMEDVTEKAVAEENLRASETKFRQLVDAAQEGLLAIDLEGNTTFVNPRMVEMLGYTPEEMLGRHLFSFVEAEQAANAKEKLIQHGQHVKAQHDLEFLCKDGLPFSTHVETNPLYDEAGNMVGVIASVFDITTSKGMQDDYLSDSDQLEGQIEGFGERTALGLKTKNAQLAQEIAERKRAETLSSQYLVEVERSNKELDHFATIASHDLQAPLRTVIGFLQLLKRRSEGRLDPALVEFVNRAINAGTDMQTMVSGLLTFSRIRVSEENLAVVDCDKVLARVIEDQQSIIAKLSATVTRDPLPTVRGVKSLLAQVFQNLLSNALKFRGADAPVIHVAVAESEKDWTFSVQDNGIGFDQQYAEAIFALFRRLHTQEEYPGNGIGLSMCKKIIERHGGKIWAESEIGKGSTFYFTLPKLTDLKTDLKNCF